MTWTTPRTWVTGETVTAALLNTHLRDNLLSFGDAWNTYTPDWATTGVAPSIGNGTRIGRYALAGKTILLYVEFVFGSTTTYGTSTFLIGLPANIRTLGSAGQAAIGGYLTGENIAIRSYNLFPRYHSPSHFELVYDHAGTHGGLAATVHSTSPFVWGTGDTFRGYLFFEAV